MVEKEGKPDRGRKGGELEETVFSLWFSPAPCYLPQQLPYSDTANRLQVRRKYFQELSWQSGGVVID
jgi:hypothetical protein